MLFRETGEKILCSKQGFLFLVPAAHLEVRDAFYPDKRALGPMLVPMHVF